MEPDATTFTYDLAISAVSSDAALVAELCAELGGRLATEPVWEGHTARGGVTLPGTLVGNQSRLAVILHQRLWQHDDATFADAATLRQRVRDHPSSVCVVLLDDTPLPQWLASAKQFDLTTNGLAGTATFALKAVASSGGAVGTVPVRSGDATSPTRWSEGSTPFVSQPRAQSALRHELDGIAAGLKAYLDKCRARQAGGAFELHVLPFRLIARLGEFGISFSWVTGRGPTVADGRLLVIEWRGVATETRGVAALKSASATREFTYRVEGADPQHWQWRVDEPNGRAYSTANLLSEWLSGAFAESIISDYI